MYDTTCLCAYETRERNLSENHKETFGDVLVVTELLLGQNLQLIIVVYYYLPLVVGCPKKYELPFV